MTNPAMPKHRAMTDRTCLRRTKPPARGTDRAGSATPRAPRWSSFTRIVARTRIAGGHSDESIRICHLVLQWRGGIGVCDISFNPRPRSIVGVEGRRGIQASAAPVFKELGNRSHRQNQGEEEFFHFIFEEVLVCSYLNGGVAFHRCGMRTACLDGWRRTPCRRADLAGLGGLDDGRHGGVHRFVRETSSSLILGRKSTVYSLPR